MPRDTGSRQAQENVEMYHFYYKDPHENENSISKRILDYQSPPAELDEVRGQAV